MDCNPELALPKGAVCEGQIFESVGPDIFLPSKLTSTLVQSQIVAHVWIEQVIVLENSD